MIVSSVGMIKSGSGWYFNLTNDLLIAAGYQDVRDIRHKFHLHSILKGRSCLLSSPLPYKMLVLIPHLLGNAFVVKCHRSPSKARRFLITTGIAKATYIYRDPRDVVVSAFERSQINRAAGKMGFFTRLETIEAAIFHVKKQLKPWDRWMQYGQALPVRYENLVNDTVHELKRLAHFLTLDVSPEKLCQIAATYRPDNLPNIAPEIGTLHFNKGITGRFREVLTTEQLSMCHKHFDGYLQRMGYDD